MLLRWEQLMAAENQHENIRLARGGTVAITDEYESMISHGKGPQIGTLAWRQSGIWSRLTNCSRRGFGHRG
jgi:carbamate kinase